MAGDWIGIDHELPDKPEVLGIHEATGEEIGTIIGRLFLLWRLMDRQTEDGRLPNAGPRSLATKCGGTPEFWGAVAAVGWVEFVDGFTVVPDFSRRFGKSARRRMKDSIRKRSGRASGQEADTVRTASGLGAPPVSVSESQSKSKSQSKSNSPPKAPPETTEDGSAAQNLCRPARQPDRSAEVRAVFEHYRIHHPKAHPEPLSSSKEWRLIRARLSDGYSVADLCSAIDGCHKTPHNQGANPRDTKYLQLTVVMKDASQVVRFCENDETPPVPRNDKERASLEAVARYVEGASDGHT